MNNRVLTALAVLALGVVLFWPSGSSKKVESLYKEGEALYANKDYEGAMQDYQLLLEIHPENAAINNENIGRAYMNLKNKRGARVFFRKALELDPENDELKKLLEKNQRS